MSGRILRRSRVLGLEDGREPFGERRGQLGDPVCSALQILGGKRNRTLWSADNRSWVVDRHGCRAIGGNVYLNRGTSCRINAKICESESAGSLSGRIHRHTEKCDSVALGGGLPLKDIGTSLTPVIRSDAIACAHTGKKSRWLGERPAGQPDATRSAAAP